MYGIADTITTQSYIKLDTPCVNKVNKHQGTQVILPDASPVKVTHKSELSLSPLLSIRAKT